MTEKYCARISVSRNRMAQDAHVSEWVNRVLVERCMQEFFPSMVADGKYHIMKFDSESVVLDDYSVEFGLICSHSVAREHNVVVARQPEIDFPVEPRENITGVRLLAARLFLRMSKCLYGAI